jgi:hypothetical protein
MRRSQVGFAQDEVNFQCLIPPRSIVLHPLHVEEHTFDRQQQYLWLSAFALVASADGVLAQGGKCCMKPLRRDPTNNAPYNYLAMVADEADPLVYFAQVAALT